jgi:Flp pilus assembly protein CpaB
LSRNLLRAVLAFAAALVMAIVLTISTKQPTLVPVTVLNATIAPGQTIRSQDLVTQEVLAPAPTGSFSSPSNVVGMIAQVQLEPGQTIVQQDIGRTYNGVPSGMVSVVVPVSVGQSAMVTLGERVDVIGELKNSSGNIQTAVLASHVLVLGVYGSNGATTAPGSPTTAPQYVALSLNPKEIATVMPYIMEGSGTSYWLVLDPAGNL